jgi:methylthioribose-1-phosphate isomerase
MRHHAQQTALTVTQKKMQGIPATIIADATASFHGLQKSMPDKGVAIARQAIPFISADCANVAGLF